MTAYNPAYLQHWGLRQPPFSKELEDTALWLPPSKRTLVDHLAEAVLSRSSALLVGEPGIGKTCILRALRHRLDGTSARLSYCSHTNLGRRDFYRQLCMILGLPPKASAAGLFYEITTHVTSLAAENLHPVVILDEAHMIKQDVLDHLHVLLNYSWDSKALLSVILVGMPHLHNRLELAANRPLYSRLSHRLVISAGTPQDTAAYVNERIEQAGATARLFTDGAIQLLHRLSGGGMLRDLDRLATAALRDAASQKLSEVDGALMQAVGKQDRAARITDGESEIN
jgi:general secretion pathway protein A